MIAISSARALKDCAPEIAANQLTAFESWKLVFDDIVYFNDPEPKLTAPNVTFVQSEDWPRIGELVRFAAAMNDWTCILNADIVVSQDFLLTEHHLRRVGACCAMSQRYEFIPLNPTIPKKVKDMGLDIFCATPEVWKKMLPLVPQEFRIGHSQWDSWTLAFLNENFRDGFYDFTPAEVIYHPRHGNRKNAYEVPKGLTPFSNFSYPVKKIA